jgi:hypothetical protein
MAECEGGALLVAEVFALSLAEDHRHPLDDRFALRKAALSSALACRAAFQFATCKPMKTPTTTITRSIAMAVHPCFLKCAMTRRRIMAARPAIGRVQVGQLG